jgi:hypothetical protein
LPEQQQQATKSVRAEEGGHSRGATRTKARTGMQKKVRPDNANHPTGVRSNASSEAEQQGMGNKQEQAATNVRPRQDHLTRESNRIATTRGRCTPCQPPNLSLLQRFCQRRTFPERGVPHRAESSFRSIKWEHLFNSNQLATTETEFNQFSF